MKNKGITLIALVITIIVLLILAGISISALTGNNGVLSNAAKAAAKSKESTVREEVALAYTSANMKKVQDPGIDFVDEFQNELRLADPDVKCLGTENNMDVYYKDYKLIINNGEILESEKINVTPVEQIKDTNPGDISKDGNGNAVSGTESSPYLICSIEDLVAFADIVSAGEITDTSTFIKLDKSLSFKSDKSYENSKRTSLTTYSLNGAVLKTHTYESNILNSLTTGTGWEPIGLSNEDGFMGTFEGNNKEIQNIFIDYVEENEEYLYYGLFNINSGVIKNLNVTGNIKVVLKSSGDWPEMYLGSIVGDNEGTISNCSSSATVIGINSVGHYCTVYSAGIAGLNGEEILGCTNTGTIIAKNEPQFFIKCDMISAGITGFAFWGTIDKCNNKGSIFSNNGYYIECAGLVGLARNVNITNCYNSGNVKVNDAVFMGEMGGIVGQMFKNTTVENCYNTGSIGYSNSNAILCGGIIGNSYNLNKTKNNFDSSKTGAISGMDFYGVGDYINLSESEITNYINTETHPTIAAPTYAIDNRLKEGVYVKYDTSSLPNASISTDLTGYNNVQNVYPSKYTGGWRVLKNKENKVELISIDTVNVGTSESSTNKRFFLRGRKGYENGVKALNQVAAAFLNENLAVSTRCVGTSSSVVETISNTLEFKPTNYNQLNLIEGYKDYQTMMYSKTEKTTNNGYYWLASRGCLCYDTETIYHVFASNGDERVNGFEIYRKKPNGSEMESTGNDAGVRPVITLRNDLEIKSGTGTSEDPYVLGTK